MTNAPDILTKILATKADEISRRKDRMSINDLEAIIQETEAPRGFANALQSKARAKLPAIIAEIKK
ncbi:MAG TPA: indole-3-glycerol-phosphate synthase TrpC, partial [Methylococcales bacterium]|nr:indole-3-glycerol-phosphate synthase TrpC [Methylococcales bacterium]